MILGHHQYDPDRRQSELDDLEEHVRLYYEGEIPSYEDQLQEQLDESMAPARGTLRIYEGYGRIVDHDWANTPDDEDQSIDDEDKYLDTLDDDEYWDDEDYEDGEWDEGSEDFDADEYEYGDEDDDEDPPLTGVVAEDPFDPDFDGGAEAIPQNYNFQSYYNSFGTRDSGRAA